METTIGIIPNTFWFSKIALSIITMEVWMTRSYFFRIRLSICKWSFNIIQSNQSKGGEFFKMCFLCHVPKWHTRDSCLSMTIARGSSGWRSTKFFAIMRPFFQLRRFHTCHVNLCHFKRTHLISTTNVIFICSTAGSGNTLLLLLCGAAECSALSGWF